MKYIFALFILAFAGPVMAGDSYSYEMPLAMHCEFPSANNKIKIVLRNKERSVDFVQMNSDRTIWTHGYVSNVDDYVQFVNNRTRTRITMITVPERTDDLLIATFRSAIHMGRRELSGFCIAILPH